MRSRRKSRSHPSPTGTCPCCLPPTCRTYAELSVNDEEAIWKNLARPDGPPAAVAWSQGVTCDPGAFHYRRVGTGASTPIDAEGTNKSTGPAGAVNGAGDVCLDTIRRKSTIPRQPDTAKRSVQSAAPPLPRPGH